MKKLFPCICISILIFACAPHRQITREVHQQVTDSIEYYETEFDIRQKNYMHLLIGEWRIDTMRRQARMDPEILSNVHMNFKSDSTFTGKASCNHISGKYTIKGTGIRFNNIISTKMACDQLEQEYEFLRLLQETVSAYTVTNNRLLLRDNSSNIIFTGRRR
jgi:heat shock protein HslJ